MCSKTNPQSLQEVRHSLHSLNRIVCAVVSVLLLYLIPLFTPAQAIDYSTEFPNAEPLISEGGHWITAGTPGVNWHETLCGGHGDRHVSSVSTTPGYAFGPTGPEPFGDALALLTGNWKPDQMAEATVHEVDPYGYPETEIRLRTSPKDATGYEIMWSALGKKGTPYIAIATWDGPGSKPPHYTILKSLKGPQYGVATGDVIKGVIVGHTIKAYTNGRLQFQITDGTFATGNPGFGFNEGSSGTYGISSFTASDTASGTRETVSSLSGTTYTTTFSLTEDPISEGGKWINGKKDGLDWADVRTTPGFAFGTEIGGDRPELQKYDDSAALLTGHWGPNQTAQATVHRVNKDDDNIYQEVELRLRSAISPRNATGYEVMFRCSKSAKAYCNIARWDGILGAWMMLKETKGSQYGVADGDVVKASINGQVITVYINGVQVLQTRDYLFTSGNPGMGFYLEKATGVNGECGFSRFMATDK
jgi:hypothetical protein